MIYILGEVNSVATWFVSTGGAFKPLEHALIEESQTEEV